MRWSVREAEGAAGQGKEAREIENDRGRREATYRIEGRSDAKTHRWRDGEREGEDAGRKERERGEGGEGERGRATEGEGGTEGEKGSERGDGSERASERRH